MDTSSTGTTVAVATQAAIVAVRPSQQSASPLTGATVIMTENNVDADLNLTPAGAIAALTVQFPVGFNGQIYTVFSSQAIAVITFTGAASILNPPTAYNAGDAYSFKRWSSTVVSRII